ncbi:uncharacterized protein TNCV_1075071 [Trichonephila clavipes]|uniref:Uncharacterized protein n=1 Tax=Trichonephila clavipes TaxID=2585209 RepID=A0A8X6SYE1_TRICX|nr:uncharacterized protein TNCV_1075071 [Trichonephila clavipes]
MSGYRELYKKIKESSSQSLITDYIVRKGRATQKENEVCENPWPLPQIPIAETVSSDDEGDLEPLRKWLVEAPCCWPGGSFGVCRQKLLRAVDTRRYPRAKNRVWSEQEDHEERGLKDRAASTCEPYSDSFNELSRRVRSNCSTNNFQTPCRRKSQIQATFPCTPFNTGTSATASTVVPSQINVECHRLAKGCI